MVFILGDGVKFVGFAGILFNIWKVYEQKFEKIVSKCRKTHYLLSRSSSVKKVFLEISQENSQENTCVRVYFLITFWLRACNFIKKENLGQVFSSEICEIFFYYYYLQTFFLL